MSGSGMSRCRVARYGFCGVMCDLFGMRVESLKSAQKQASLIIKKYVCLDRILVCLARILLG